MPNNNTPVLPLFKAELTASDLYDILIYNKITGEFVWKNRDRKFFKTTRSWNTFNSQFAGRAAGTLHPSESGKTYLRIQILGDLYLAHRLAWLYVTGAFPTKFIDHIDGNGINNKFENLREVERIENAKNRKLNKNNASGVSGISWSKKDNKWRVRIGEKFIGNFIDFDEAVYVRKVAMLDNNYHRNHGTIRPL